MKKSLAAAVLAAIASRAAISSAAPGAGTLADPVVVDAFPYAVRGTTVGAANAIDDYACAAALDESGGEIVYAFTLDAPARVSAWVEGDGGAVDIDVHLLDSLALAGATSSDCVARGNVIAEAAMGPGTHYVVVDTYAGAAQAGPFVLRLDAIGDAWNERPIGEGVVWRARRFADLGGGPQVVHELVVDTSSPDVTIEAVPASGCQTVASLGAEHGALAGINGGYFNVSTCAPVSLLKYNGALLATNGAKRGAFGLSAAMEPMIAILAAGADWPEAHEAHGGGPVLVEAGAAHAGASDWGAQGFNSASFNGPNPRTFAGFDGAGRVHFGSVDGRRDTAAGMSLDALAAFTASSEIGTPEAVNLDGGGSTTMWIAGATPNGVVNYPSDDPDQELPTHPGSRGVSGGFLVFAPPYNHPPRFQTEPVLDAVAGEPYAYDADAIDIDVDDVVTFSLVEAPAGMTIDPASGEIAFAPTAASPPEATVTIEAADDHGAAATQTFTLVIEGGLGPPDAGAGGGGGQGGEGGGSAPDEGGAAAASDDGGCACRTTGPGEGGASAALALIFGALCLRARRRAGALRWRPARRTDGAR